MLRRTIALILIHAVLCTAVLLGLSCAPAQLEAYPAGGSKGRVDLLIITSQKLLAETEKLAEFKTRSGIRSAVVTTGGIEAHFTGRDLPEKMRNCAIDYRKRRGTADLLLIGDTSLVPTRYVFCPDINSDMSPQQIQDIQKAGRSGDLKKYQVYFIPTELYFANLVDDWDINRNGVYGEMKALTGLDRDEGGFSSQLATGRIPARNSADLALVVDKIIGYQPLDIRKALFISAMKDTGQGQQAIDGPRFSAHITSGLRGAWGTTIVSEGQPECTGPGVVRLLNRGGFNLVVGVTHGFPFALTIDSIKRLQVLSSHMPAFMDSMNVLAASEKVEKSDWYKSLEPALVDTRMVDDLKNPAPFFFMGFGCYISAIDYGPHYSITEQLVMQKNGAIAACGISRDDFMHEENQASLEGPGGLHFEIGNLMLKNLSDGSSSFGRALAKSVEEYAASNSAFMSSPDNRTAVFSIALTGDPTLHLLR